MTTTNTAIGRQPFAGRRDGLHASPSARIRSRRRRRRRLVARLVLAERLADARDELEVALRFARLDRALGRQVDVDDAARSGPAAPT